MSRKALIDRKTKETVIKVELDLDGSGQAEVDTGIPFMNHMLGLMAVHGFLDLKVIAQGDTEIDDHHTVEDLGICLGEAIDQALVKREGIRRFGHAIVPMDEALSRVTMDISNRPFLAYRVTLKETKAGNFDIGLIKEFFRALAHRAGITLHVDLFSGDDAHHIAESIFKSFGRALDHATALDSRLAGKVPSTKGIL